jgi:hypothetical protein
MTHKTNRTARYFIAVGAAAALLSIAGGSVFAGEITGNGTLKEVHGRSSCAYSGQEDLQWYTDNGDGTLKPVATKGDPGHAQSWGQLDKATRDYLTSIGLNPGIACNPNLATPEG